MMIQNIQKMILKSLNNNNKILVMINIIMQINFNILKIKQFQINYRRSNPLKIKTMKIIINKIFKQLIQLDQWLGDIKIIIMN